MQRHAFECLGRPIELWTHPEPDHLARAIAAQRGFYEIDVLMKCRELYVPGTTVVDVGANVGNHTVFFAAIVGAPVLAFEPWRANHDLLLLNIAANGLDELVEPTCAAVGSIAGSGRAQPRRADNFGTVQVVAGPGDIPVVVLDDMPTGGPVGLLKVDVEGAEPAVLEGAQELLERWLPDVVVEAEDAAAFAAVADVLLPAGYFSRGRYAWTPTYVFSATDQATRLRRVLDAGRVTPTGAAAPPPRPAPRAGRS